MTLDVPVISTSWTSHLRISLSSRSGHESSLDAPFEFHHALEVVKIHSIGREFVTSTCQLHRLVRLDTFSVHKRMQELTSKLHLWLNLPRLIRCRLAHHTRFSK